MSALGDMVATYRGPGRVVRRQMAGGAGEERALAVVMAACGLIFVAQLPRLARQAEVTGESLNPLLGASLMAWGVLAPLLLYALGGLIYVVLRLARRRISGFGARLALFWALFASVPVILLHGLVAGFLGTGPQLTLVGVIWLAIFLWFWIAGTWAATGGTA